MEKNLKSVTKKEPCQHCGKTDWCYTLSDKLSVCKRNAEPALGWQKTSKQDQEGSYYYAPIERKTKEIRTKQRREWEYPDRNGSKLVRVVRIDKGDGNKKIWQEHWNGKTWIKGLGDINRENIPIYRFNEVKKAINDGLTIFVVEGEAIADLLWKLGIPATTNIGGSKKWKPSDSQDLEGAKIVICPDRDVPGLEHALKIYEDFPEAQWLYAYSESNVWNNLPPSNGLDLADWISDYELSAEDILASVEPLQRIYQPTIKSFQPQSVEVQTGFALTKWKKEAVLEQINLIIELSPSKTELKGLLNDLAHESLWQLKELYGLHRLREKELEFLDSFGDLKLELDKILKANKTRLNLLKHIPQMLIKPILKRAKRLNLRPEVLMTALFCGVSSVHHQESKLTLSSDLDFVVTPNLFGAIIAESSQKKTPVLKSMVTKPLKHLQKKALLKYEQELEEYEDKIIRYQDLKSKASKDEQAKEELEAEFPSGKPKEPSLKVYLFNDSTGEGIINQAGNQNQGFLMVKDEIAGVFKSENKYRGGRGSDQEDLLEFYDGSGSITLRASGLKTYTDNVILSMIGGIQPKVLNQFLGDYGDENGRWARFLFVHQPVTASTLGIDTGQEDITRLIQWLYEKFDEFAHKPVHLKLSRAAYQYFAVVYDHLEEKRIETIYPAMAHVYGKTAGRIGKIAFNLHVMKAIAEGLDYIPEEIDLETMKSATEISCFYAQQIESLYLSVDGSFQGLPGKMAKVLEIAQRKNDWISPRDVCNAFTSTNRPENREVKEWFKQLEMMEKGETLTNGRTVKFKVKPPESQPNNSFDDPPSYFNSSHQKPMKVDHNSSVVVQEKPPITINNEPINLQTDLSENISNNVTINDTNNLAETVNNNEINKIENQKVNVPVNNNNLTVENHHNSVEETEDLEVVIWLLEYCETKENLQYLREIIEAETLRKASRKLSQEKYQQICIWVTELDQKKQLSVGDSVEIIATKDKGKQGIIIKIKDLSGYSYDGVIEPEGFEFSLIIEMFDGSHEYFYPNQVRKINSKIESD